MQCRTAKWKPDIHSFDVLDDHLAAQHFPTVLPLMNCLVHSRLYRRCCCWRALHPWRAVSKDIWWFHSSFQRFQACCTDELFLVQLLLELVPWPFSSYYWNTPDLLKLCVDTHDCWSISSLVASILGLSVLNEEQMFRSSLHVRLPYARWESQKLLWQRGNQLATYSWTLW